MKSSDIRYIYGRETGPNEKVVPLSNIEQIITAMQKLEDEVTSLKQEKEKLQKAIRLLVE